MDYKIRNKIHTPLDGEFHFEGFISEKFNNMIRERMTSDNAHNLVFKEAEDAFDLCEDDKDAPLGLWHGEFWGKLMISMCRGYRYTKDESMLDFIKKSTYKIMSHQRDDGYIGTYKNERHIFACDPKKGLKIQGWDCNWTWNIWCRKYTLWGMLEAYEVLNDEKILESAAKSADQLIDMLKSMGARICETGTFYGLPSGSILKPMLILYRHTNNKKYLDFALEIAKEWQDSDDSSCVKIISRSLAGLPITNWNDNTGEIPAKSGGNPYPSEDGLAFRPDYFKPTTSGKIYEMNSCFDGLLELYRITGDKLYLQATECFFRLMIKYEYNTLFSIGFNDTFANAANYQNSVTELCDVIHFIRVATELYKLTADISYMEYIELAFYNPFLAGVTRDGKGGARGVRPLIAHIPAAGQINMKYNHCCLNNAPRGYVNVAESFVMSGKDSVYINLFSPFTATVRPTKEEAVTVKIGDGYLENQTTEITINADIKSDKKLFIRIPEWSKNTKITINGKVFSPENGQYLEVPLTSGKTKILAEFDKSPCIIESKFYTGFYPITPWQISRYYISKERRDAMKEENKCRVTVGPVLLSSALMLGSTKEEIFDRPTICKKNYSCKVTPKTVDGTMCAFDVTFDNGSDSFVRPMCDFASASDTNDYVDYRYNIFI